ncbi:MAG: phosphate ABC transporter permease PtsA, partial [Acidobacteria bacterium]|nr:phosphate ABC transporter permease PtsA [Acidobacteriota bacterium]
MKKTSSLIRKSVDLIYRIFATAFAFLAIFILAVIIYEVLKRGFAAINWSFFFRLPKPPGEEGSGIANALFGSAVITSI